MVGLRSFLVKYSAALAVGIGLLIAAGCGDDSGIAKRYPVSGTVTYKNEPLAKGRIDFIPEDPNGRAAGGDIENGSYRLTTVNPGDGAIPGDYKVTVTALEIDLSAGAETAGAGQQFRQSKEFVKVAKAAKKLVPEKYMRVDTSGLTAKVEAKTNRIDFNLED